MPEGPEVKHYAEHLAEKLDGNQIVDITARTKNAKSWLLTHRGELLGKRILEVSARGKNIIGIIDGGYYFYSHQMMWGRWLFVDKKEIEAPTSKERARITVPEGAAILNSAPVFELGHGDPFTDLGQLRNLGPDVLQSFDSIEFLKRLKEPKNKTRTIGDALLDQTILAGIGNYLRAEIMFLAQLNPWTKVSALKKAQLNQLVELIPKISQQAYDKNGVTVTPKLQKRMSKDPTLVYVPNKPFGCRHYVFRRTNLPCLVCAEAIRQLRQELDRQNKNDEDAQLAGDAEETKASRITYFCPNCQNVEIDSIKKVKMQRRV